MDQRNCILIIDGDPLALGALSTILSSQYLVKATSNGDAGLLMAEEYGIDLIILDLPIKGTPDHKLLTTLKTNDKTKDIPVVIVTGSEACSDEIAALRNGAVDYIRKPFVAEVVTLRVGIHLKLLTQMRMIERFSLTDGLTGTNNRRCFDQQLKIEWTRAARTGSWISLLMIDIDHFKQFNDEYGHLSGDAALKTVAGVLTNTVQRGSDYVFRWGGEEFAVILPETSVIGAKVVAEKIRANIEAAPVTCSGEFAHITASIGASTIIPDPSGHSSAMEEFCEEVDRALYKAKGLGRNKIVIA
ncbi:MAG: diguanylate cyclase [Defluviitaleaceae bacterium]|nr:diguanylate cyclase [Defluviitaleaceae bacterium]